MKSEAIAQLQQTLKHAKTEHYYMRTQELGWIVQRYEKAIQLLSEQGVNQWKEEDFSIWNGVSLYLQGILDYTNPLIPELTKSERLLRQYLTHQQEKHQN